MVVSVEYGGTVYVGKFVHSLGLGNLQYVEGSCKVSRHGVIEAFGADFAFPEGYEVVRMEEGQFMIPGFIDTHTHAAQYANLGIGLQLELLDWLDQVTFPTESAFSRPPETEESEESHSKRINLFYQNVAMDYLRKGTTTCCYFGSIQLEANLALARAVRASGQRAFVGKVCMDCNSPDHYIESTEQSLRDTASFCHSVIELDQGRGLVQPIVTPRFAITCSRGLMKGLGDLARNLDLNIQTHLSENKNEVAFTKELFPEAKHYTDVYEQAGLLTSKTILAHSIYLSEEEQDLIKERHSALSHCPNSNFALTSGIMPLRRYLEKGLRIGLGTDVSGGYSNSIMDAIRQAIIGSKCLFFQNADEPVTVGEAFHLATLGGAEALALHDKIGNFAPGKRFDALMISPRMPTTGRIETDFERFILCGDDRDIHRTYVDGIVVSSST